VQEWNVNETGEISSEVLAKAKEKFTKRTRTLYRCVYPNIKKHQLERRVRDDWFSVPENERNIYILEVSHFLNNLQAISLSFHIFSVII
jgi:transposase